MKRWFGNKLSYAKTIQRLIFKGTALHRFVMKCKGNRIGCKKRLKVSSQSKVDQSMFSNKAGQSKEKLVAQENIKGNALRVELV